VIVTAQFFAWYDLALESSDILFVAWVLYFRQEFAGSQGSYWRRPFARCTGILTHKGMSSVNGMASNFFCKLFIDKITPCRTDRIMQLELCCNKLARSSVDKEERNYGRNSFEKRSKYDMCHWQVTEERFTP
jgi:hypothetical protein